jgi:ectoine hydroxylase-related dioxygenase (phytanoyl-CoA dioxygenase family)
MSDPLLQLELSGYTVLPDLLTAGECEEARRELDRVFAAERELPGAPHGPHGAWAYNLMNKGRIFERLYQVPELLRVLRHFLGADAVLSGCMARLVLPGSPEQALHYDGSLTGPYQAGAEADRGLRDVSLVFGMNVIWCLTDFTARDGATRVVPGSHRLPSREVPRDSPPPGVVAIEAPRGSALVFNIATWHGAGAHQGTEPRYALLTPWRRSWVRPEVDLSRMVRPDVLERAGPEGPVIFGLQARPPYVERWQWDRERGQPRPEWDPTKTSDQR